MPVIQFEMSEARDEQLQKLVPETLRGKRKAKLRVELVLERYVELCQRHPDLVSDSHGDTAVA
jgi:hypothetical protein